MNSSASVDSARIRFRRSKAIISALLAGLFVATVSVAGWAVLVKRENAHVRQLISEREVQLLAVLDNELRQLIGALSRMASRWEVVGGARRELWTIDAKNYIEDFGYYQAIEWADPSFKVQWIEPLEGNEAAQGLDLSFEPRRHQALIDARESGKYTSTTSIDLVQGGKGFIVFYPIGSGETFGGFILGVFRIAALFSKLTDELQTDFAIEVRENETVIYASNESENALSRNANRLPLVRVDVLGNEWRLALYPRASFLKSVRSRLPFVFLCLGLLLALSLAGLTYFGMMTLESLALVKDSEERYRFLTERMNDMIWAVDAEVKFTYVSPSCERVLGFTPEELIGQPLATIIDAESLPEFADYIAKVTRGDLEDLSYETLAQKKSGEKLYLGVNAVVIFDGSQAVSVQGISRDITEQRVAEAALRRSELKYRNLATEYNELSHIDALTGIPNRRAFDKGLVEEWRRAQRERTTIGIILIDIDFFKQYNDQYGHQAGDDCLRRVAEILDGQVLRAGDRLARYGGEEFVAILPNSDPNSVKIVGEKLRMAVADSQIPHEFSGASDWVTISLGGAAMSPTQDDRYEQLVELADQALYQAKESGRNRFRLHAVPAQSMGWRSD